MSSVVFVFYSNWQPVIWMFDVGVTKSIADCKWRSAYGRRTVLECCDVGVILEADRARRRRMFNVFH